MARDDHVITRVRVIPWAGDVVGLAYDFDSGKHTARMVGLKDDPETASVVARELARVGEAVPVDRELWP